MLEISTMLCTLGLISHHITVRHSEVRQRRKSVSMAHSQKSAREICTRRMFSGCFTAQRVYVLSVMLEN